MTIPKGLRLCFKYDRKLLGVLSQCFFASVKELGKPPQTAVLRRLSTTSHTVLGMEPSLGPRSFPPNGEREAAYFIGPPFFVCGTPSVIHCGAGVPFR